MHSRSIKKTILFFVLAASTCVVVGYTLLVADYFETGLDLSIQMLLEGEAVEYSEQFRLNPNIEFPRSANLKVYGAVSELPNFVQSALAEKNVEHGIPISMFSSVEDEASEVYFCVLPWVRPDGKMLMFMYEIGDGNTSLQADRVFEIRLFFIVGVAIVLFLGMAGMAIFLFRKIVDPVGAISRWAQNLDKGNIDEPVDFQYTELNGLADLFRETLCRMMAGVEREHAFLRNASHELRTPVAVLQNNLELIHRIGADGNPRTQAPLRRMNNAVANMNNIISTLLWLSRENAIPFERCSIDMHWLVTSIIDENAYLLDGKENHLEQKLFSVSVVAQEPLVRIVVNNVVRNAFQHTYHGRIEISLNESEILVMNDNVFNDEGRSQESYCVGLMLVSQLVEKLDWGLAIEEQPDCFSVRLSMNK